MVESAHHKPGVSAGQVGTKAATACLSATWEGCQCRSSVCIIPTCNILLDDGGRLLLLPEHAALLPGVPQQVLPAQAVPLAPEARGRKTVDGRADQFALAALAYWLFCGRWPEVARALAPRPEVRFEALSEFEQALRQPLLHQPAATRRYRQRWQLAVLGLLVLQLGIGLWLSLEG